MARAKKAKVVEVVKKNPGIFTEEELASYRKTLIEEIHWRAKGSLTSEDIEALADSVFQNDEKTTLWMRRKGMLFVSNYLIGLHSQRSEQEGNVAS